MRSNSEGLGLGGILLRRKALVIIAVLVAAYVGSYLIMSRCPALSFVYQTYRGPVLVFGFFEVAEVEYGRNTLTGKPCFVKLPKTREYVAFYAFLPLIAADAQLGNRYHYFLQQYNGVRGAMERQFWGQY